MEVVEVKIGELKLAEYNPRQWDDKAVADLTASIKEFGMVDPLIVNSAPKRKNVVIGGHFRLQVAKNMGLKTVPVVYVNILKLEKEQELNLRLNKNQGVWDWDLLANFDVNELLRAGFEEVDLEKQFDLYPDNEKDDVIPEVPKKPISKLGELYQLGEHRLLCGDSTKKEDVERLMDGKKADMVFTDPPYGQSFDIKGDTKSEYRGIFDGAIGAITIFAKDNYYICCNYACIGYFAYRVEELGLQIYDKVVWYKNLFGQGTLYHRQHEDIIFCGNGNYLKDKRNDDVDVWQINSMRNFAGNKTAKEDVGHPTQKPSELSARAIKNSSKQDDIVLDLFGGSGSTLIACEQTNRTCYMMEIDPKYCDVIRKRYANYIEKGGSWQMETPKI